jgi:hypothetical protein
MTFARPLRNSAREETKQLSPFNKEDREQIKVNVSKALTSLQLRKLSYPEESIKEIIKNKIEKSKQRGSPKKG